MAVAVASMPSSLATTMPLSAAQFPDHANWADTSPQKDFQRGDVKMEAEDDEEEEEEGERGESDSSGHNSNSNTHGDSDSDIASSRPPTPTDPSDEGTKEVEIVKQEPPSEETLELAPESAATSPKNSWISEIRPPKLSDDELDNAKVLVLDLLGWGVPPEYILQRGVSIQLLYTVFTDLRLRLPDTIFADCVALADRLSMK